MIEQEKRKIKPVVLDEDLFSAKIASIYKRFSPNFNPDLVQKGT